MTVTETQSTNKKISVYTSTSTTLVTAVGEVINAIEHIPAHLVQFQITYEDTGKLYIVSAFVKR